MATVSPAPVEPEGAVSDPAAADRLLDQGVHAWLVWRLGHAEQGGAVMPTPQVLGQQAGLAIEDQHGFKQAISE